MCCLCSALISGETVKAQRETQALSFFVFSFTVILLLMAYSFASLHSACLRNNEGVCCINLCNGEREEGWDGGGEAVKEEGENRRVMSSCCCTAALLYTLCTLCCESHVHTLAHAQMHVCSVSLCAILNWFTDRYACTCRQRVKKNSSLLKSQPHLVFCCGNQRLASVVFTSLSLISLTALLWMGISVCTLSFTCTAVAAVNKLSLHRSAW